MVFQVVHAFTNDVKEYRKNMEDHEIVKLFDGDFDITVEQIAKKVGKSVEEINLIINRYICKDDV